MSVVPAINPNFGRWTESNESRTHGTRLETQCSVHKNDVIVRDSIRFKIGKWFTSLNYVRYIDSVVDRCLG